MNKWKISFFIVLSLGIAIAVIQQSAILGLKYANDDYSSLINRVNSDLESIRICFLKDYKKKNFLSQLKNCDPEVKIFEYDLGNVKMSGIDIGFDKDQNIINISTQLY